MLIVNADDFGKNREISDRILLCFIDNRITSTSAMMFMADTERSAERAREVGLNVGLHLNLSDPFTGRQHNPRLNECQERLGRYLARNRYRQLLYNPFLRKEFEYTFRSQWDRFTEVYGYPPPRLDGHRHFHLCWNMIMHSWLPAGLRVRRNFHWSEGEKGTLNRIYRRAVDRYLARRFVCSNYFFSLSPFQQTARLRWIADLSRNYEVELMVHPHLDKEMSYVMGVEYAQLFSELIRGAAAMWRQENA